MKYAGNNPFYGKCLKRIGILKNSTEKRARYRSLDDVQYCLTEEAKEKPGEVDIMLDQAVRLFIQEGRTSVGILQIHLKIGYARAKRIMDRMTEFGILKRKRGKLHCIINMEEWNEMKKDFPFRHPIMAVSGVETLNETVRAAGYSF